MSTNKEYISQNKAAAKRLYNITPFTLLDYPGKIACILWFAGCNMRCVYCYNPDIVLGKGNINYSEALAFIQSRKHLLEGVVLSGGECTLHKGIAALILEIRKLGMLIKIDTNGSNPPMLNILLRKGLVDYVALDFKATPEKFFDMTRSTLFNGFESTLSLLINSTVDFEVRTTVHAELLSEEDLKWMVTFLEEKGYKGTYYIQYYINNTRTLMDLNYSVQRINFEALSTPDIRIVVRK
ncbi:anaerobic ribonucleoside-triphosphate reductase activating protein [Pedobacter sp. AW31-3R]|uniref:anaerobic ribonucleoside-triphosphate reductase activating protein n=1 Tax=Pedobacter sp. AW31-3R TaxID=3445781 RepID=UPI003F9F11FD